MTLRRRLYVLYVGMFALVLGGALVSIYVIYRQYREEVFYERLKSRIVVTTRLLYEIRVKDSDLMDVLDVQTIHSLFDEKVIIFDEKGAVVYASLDDTPISYDPAILKKIRSEGEWRSEENDNEVYGLHYNHAGRDYVALASALDVTGLRMIEHLTTALVAAFIVGLSIVVTTSRSFVSRTLRPITRLRAAISAISPDDLSVRLPVDQTGDELAEIAVSFNGTLDRLRSSFEFQRHFVHYASHELNTPVAVITAVLDRVRNGPQDVGHYQAAFDEISEVHHRSSELLSSLLFLSGLDSARSVRGGEPIRLDELTFDAIEVVSIANPSVRVLVDVDVSPSAAYPLEVHGSAPLLRTAISNMLANAIKYTSDGRVRCRIQAEPEEVVVTVINQGRPIPEEYREDMYRPFVRIQPTPDVPGKGLGLAIVHRIAELHGGSITYHADTEEGNVFNLHIPAALRH
ncbi:MAG: HAMP domain-containing histidine kinase [Candidatus Kapabacteria bacterium]|nr:HAMP domain-containing histidine kinase [Candidatus Kapabacteria bacterium]